jgi:hypothetical protein
MDERKVKRRFHPPTVSRDVFFEGKLCCLFCLGFDSGSQRWRGESEQRPVAPEGPVSAYAAAIHRKSLLGQVVFICSPESKGHGVVAIETAR